MKCIPTQDAVGHILCHDITEIVPSVSKSAAFRKGHVVREEDIPRLLNLGKEHLYIWENRPDHLHENEAARVLYAACDSQPARIRPSEIREGKIECIATVDGVLEVDVPLLDAINNLGEMMIATRHSHFPVKAGQTVAAARIIPLTIEKVKMDRVREMTERHTVLRIHPFSHKRVGIVTTGSEIAKGRIADAFGPALRAKLAEYSASVIGQEIVGDDPAEIARAIRGFRQAGAELILCTGGMSVDPDDATPGAIAASGATVVRYGAPVLPGAMLLLGYFGDGVPILGLPGCVMYARRTIFDLILPRVLADVPITSEDLGALGHGGLCLSCEVCTFPQCGFGK